MEQLQEELDALAIGPDGVDGDDSLLDEQSGVSGPLEVGRCWLKHQEPVAGAEASACRHS
jgi:hypothetical protein